MAEEIVIPIVAVAHSEGLTDAARDIKALKGETDKLGDSFDTTSRDAFDLTDQITKTRAQVKQLATEFSRTGDKSLLRGLREQRSMLAQLERVAKDMQAGDEVAGSLEHVDETATKAGASLRGMSFDAKALNAEIAKSTARLKELDLQLLSVGGDDKDLRRRIRDERSWLGEMRRISKDPGGGASGFAGLLSSAGQLGTSLRGAMVPALIGAAVAASPFIGAAISGAVVGAVGLGGIAGGIAAASRDEGVRGEARNLGATISDHFFGSGGAMVEPLKRTMRELGSDFARLDLAGLFAKGAPAVEILGRGVGDLAHNLMPGLNAVMDKAVPIAEALADGLGAVGFGVSDALTAMAGSEGTVEGLRDSFVLLGDAIRTAGDGLTWLADLYYDLKTGDVFAEPWRELTGTDMPAYMHAVGQATEGATGSVIRQRTAVEELNKALDTLIGKAMSLDQAQIAAQKGALDLTEALRENGRHWEDNTAKGLANQQALLSQVERLNQVREAEIAAGGSVDVANATFRAQLENLLRIAEKGGATKKVLEDLVGEYILKIRTINITEYRTELSAKGYTGGRGYGIRGFASGGTTPAFEPFRVHRDETVWSDRQHYVATAAQTREMARGGGGGPANVTIRVESGGGEFEDMMARMLARWVSANGGDVQLAMGR